MTTKGAGGRITGLLALTLEAQVALEKGDPVMITGDYECGLANGTKPMMGTVSVANKEPVRGVATRPAQVPGDVTVEARCFYVRTLIAAGAIAAGVGFRHAAAGAIVAVAADAVGLAARIDGIVLSGASGAGEAIDVAYV